MPEILLHIQKFEYLEFLLYAVSSILEGWQRFDAPIKQIQYAVARIEAIKRHAKHGRLPNENQHAQTAPS